MSAFTAAADLEMNLDFRLPLRLMDSFKVGHFYLMALAIKSPISSLRYPEGQRLISFLIKKSGRSVIFPKSNGISENSFVPKMRLLFCRPQLVEKWLLMTIFKITEWLIKKPYWYVYDYISHTYKLSWYTCRSIHGHPAIHVQLRAISLTLTKVAPELQLATLPSSFHP